MTHQHDFIRINDCSKPRKSIPGESHPISWNGQIDGAIVGCSGCGEVRRVWSDGSVEVTHKGTPGEALD